VGRGDGGRQANTPAASQKELARRLLEVEFPKKVSEILGHTRNVIDNKGSKMRKMRMVGHTRNIYENT
jgi:hypothetical protein